MPYSVTRILACIHLARDVVVLENFYKYLAISDSLWSWNTMLLCLHFNATCNNAFISLSRHKRVQLGLKESQMVYWWFWSISFSGVCIMGNQYTNTPLRYTSKLVSHPIIRMSLHVPFLKGELCLLRLLLFFAHSKEVAEEDFFLAGLFLSASRCSLRSCSLFCFCKAIRCCCKDRLGMSPV